MISGNIINPDNREANYVYFDEDMMEQHNNTQYEYITLSSYFNNELKEQFTGEEIKDLYFLIKGKTKEEVEQILSNSNINDTEKPKTLVRK